MMPKTLVGVTIAAMFVAACGAEVPEAQGRLRAPETGHTRMTLAPALDVSSIVDPALLDRLVIDEVLVNVDDVRLLGADPRLPTGGMRMLAGQKQLSTLGESPAFPLPAGLGLEDLALFVHLTPSAELEGASVVVRARLYSSARLASLQSFRGLSSEPDPDGSPATTDPTKEPDPDGSPATTDPTKEPDPDGSPAHGGSKKGGGEGIACEPDPDGSPAIRNCKATQRAVVAGDYVSFELRGDDVADLLVSLNPDSPFDVVLGVPAARWLTPDAIAGLEQALVDAKVDNQELRGESPRRETVVVPAANDSRDMTAKKNGNAANDGNTMANDKDDDYRLLGGGEADPGSIRKH